MDFITIARTDENNEEEQGFVSFAEQFENNERGTKSNKDKNIDINALASRIAQKNLKELSTETLCLQIVYDLTTEFFKLTRKTLPKETQNEEKDPKTAAEKAEEQATKVLLSAGKQAEIAFKLGIVPTKEAEGLKLAATFDKTLSSISFRSAVVEQLYKSISENILTEGVKDFLKQLGQNQDLAEVFCKNNNVFLNRFIEIMLGVISISEISKEKAEINKKAYEEVKLSSGGKDESLSLNPSLVNDLQFQEQIKKQVDTVSKISQNIQSAEKFVKQNQNFIKKLNELLDATVKKIRSDDKTFAFNLILKSEESIDISLEEAEIFNSLIDKMLHGSSEEQIKAIEKTLLRGISGKTSEPSRQIVFTPEVVEIIKKVIEAKTKNQHVDTIKYAFANVILQMFETKFFEIFEQMDKQARTNPLMSLFNQSLFLSQICSSEEKYSSKSFLTYKSNGSELPYKVNRLVVKDKAYSRILAFICLLVKSIEEKRIVLINKLQKAIEENITEEEKDAIYNLINGINTQTNRLIERIIDQVQI